MIYTTLNKILACGPCGQEEYDPQYGWQKLLNYLGKTQADDEPLSFVDILRSNGLDDALWCCRSAPEHNEVWEAFRRWCHSQVEHLWDAEELLEKYPEKDSVSLHYLADTIASALAWDQSFLAHDTAWGIARMEQEKEFLKLVG